jgi:hypothetical protein
VQIERKRKFILQLFGILRPRRRQAGAELPDKREVLAVSGGAAYIHFAKLIAEQNEPYEFF